MSQDRLRLILRAAVEAGRASEAWRPGDGLCVILADDDATILSAQGFITSPNLADCLEFHAHKQRQAAHLADVGPALVVVITRYQQQELDPLLNQAEGWTAEDRTTAADLIMAAYKLGRQHSDGTPP